jgi:hypothetical protein
MVFFFGGVGEDLAKNENKKSQTFENGGFQSPEVTGPPKKKEKKIIGFVPLVFIVYSQNIENRLNLFLTSYLVYSQIWLHLCRDDHQFSIFSFYR